MQCSPRNYSFDGHLNANVIIRVTMDGLAIISETMLLLFLTGISVVTIAGVILK